MKTKLFQKVNNQGGSATIEAVVSFTGFLLVIFTLLSLVNLCRAQMLISSAMDNAAKELSQYSYFYKMSGLQKIDKALGDKADVGKSHIDGVIGSVDNLYSSMVDAVDQTTEDYTSIAEATKTGAFNMDTFKGAYDNLSSSAGDVGEKFNALSAQVEDIGDNPMLYMKSLVAIASSTGMDLLKSHAIAAPLAKFFMRQQFGENKDEANKTLIGLGVKDGLNGMNFKMSSVFSTQHKEDIRLVVYYKLTLLQFFDWEVLEVNMYKQSACRAWLAGDDPEEFVLAEDLTTGPSEEGSTGEGSGETTNPTGPADSTEATEPTVSTEPTEPTGPSSSSDGTWNSGAYKDTIPYLYHYAPNTGVLQMSDPETLKNDKPTVLFDNASFIKAEDGTAGLICADVMSNMSAIGQYLEEYDTEDVDRVLMYTIYVPKNISEEEKKKIEDAKDDAEDLIDLQLEILNNENNTSGIKVAKNVEYEINIKYVGEHDYSSGGAK